MDHSKSSGNRLLKLTLPPIEAVSMHIALASRSALPLFHFGNGVGRAYLVISAVIWKNLRWSKP
jgi:hypothetical protein